MICCLFLFKHLPAIKIMHSCHAEFTELTTFSHCCASVDSHSLTSFQITLNVHQASAQHHLLQEILWAPSLETSTGLDIACVHFSSLHVVIFYLPLFLRQRIFYTFHIFISKVPCSMGYIEKKTFNSSFSVNR